MVPHMSAMYYAFATNKHILHEYHLIDHIDNVSMCIIYIMTHPIISNNVLYYLVGPFPLLLLTFDLSSILIDLDSGKI